MIAVVFEFTPAPGRFPDEESERKWRDLQRHREAQAPEDSVRVHG